MQIRILFVVALWIGLPVALLGYPGTVPSPSPRTQFTHQLTSLNLDLQALHRQTLELFRQEKNRSSQLLITANNFTLDSVTFDQDRVMRHAKNVAETIRFNDQLSEMPENVSCSMPLRVQRSIITDRALRSEFECADTACTGIHESTHTRFYAFRDECLRQSGRSQWLAIAMLAEKNAVTETAQIIDTLRETIGFSHLMWDGTVANAQEEVHRIGKDMLEVVSGVQKCGNEAFVVYDKELRENMVRSLWC